LIAGIAIAMEAMKIALSGAVPDYNRSKGVFVLGGGFQCISGDYAITEGITWFNSIAE